MMHQQCWVQPQAGPPAATAAYHYGPGTLGCGEDRLSAPLLLSRPTVCVHLCVFTLVE